MFNFSLHTYYPPPPPPPACQGEHKLNMTALDEEYLYVMIPWSGAISFFYNPDSVFWLRLVKLKIYSMYQSCSFQKNTCDGTKTYLFFR